MTPSHVLLTGATGYIGGRLLAELERRRRLGALSGPPAGSVARPRRALDRDRRWRRARRGGGVPSSRRHRGRVLLDPLDGRRGLRSARPRGRANLRRGCAREAAFGGSSISAVSARRSGGLSEHLRSRQETGEILRRSGVPVVELRASIVLGSGSLSFEMIRALVERLPVMICPRWVAVEAQPIAVEDVIAYLVAALDLPAGAERIYEIGGPDRVTYGDLMREYARQRGLKRLLIPVPLLTPRLSSLWLGLVTPLYARVGRKLVDSLRNPTVIRDPAALAALPGQTARRARGDRPGPRERGRGLRPDALVGRRLLLGADRALRGRSRRHSPDRQPADVRSGTAGRGLRADPAHRRRGRLVLRQFPLAPARIPRPSRSEGSGCAAGAAGPTSSSRAMPSISGASNPTSPTACCGCAPR